MPGDVRSSLEKREARGLGRTEAPIEQSSLLDQLYGVPLDEFTTRRSALAKELAAEGRRDEAGEVRRLKKPRLSAWAVNQLARRERDSVGRLLEAGERVQSADSPETVRKATQERHALVQQLAKRAEEILADAGQSRSSATLHQVTQTLYATTSAEERDRLRRGVLTDPLEGAGFEQVLGIAQPDAALEARADQRTERATRELRRLQDELREAELEAKRLRGDAERASRSARAAEHEAAVAERHVERLRQRAARQEEALEAD